METVDACLGYHIGDKLLPAVANPKTRHARNADRSPAMTKKTLSPELLYKMDASWRAANYLSIGQIYLFDNPLLKRPLALADIKHMLLGHWGTTPGQNFIYVHLNRVIKKYDLDMIYVSGPGHGGPAVVANTYLEGTYSEIYPHISREDVLAALSFASELFKEESFVAVGKVTA